MAKGLLDQIDASIKKEIDGRRTGDFAPERVNFLEIKFESRDAMRTGD